MIAVQLCFGENEDDWRMVRWEAVPDVGELLTVGSHSQPSEDWVVTSRTWGTIRRDNGSLWEASVSLGLARLDAFLARKFRKHGHIAAQFNIVRRVVDADVPDCPTLGMTCNEEQYRAIRRILGELTEDGLRARGYEEKEIRILRGIG